MISSAKGSRTRLPARNWLPNLLSLARLALAPVAVRAILLGHWRQAALLLAAAGITDGLDGFLARRWGAATRVGAWLDPIADKALLSATYVALGLTGALPWWLVVLVPGRDLMILAGAGAAIIFKRRRDFPPSVWGKISTVVQVATAAAAVLARAWPEAGLVQVTRGLVWLAAAATLWSGLDYARRGLTAGGWSRRLEERA